MGPMVTPHRHRTASVWCRPGSTGHRSSSIRKFEQENAFCHSITVPHKGDTNVLTSFPGRSIRRSLGVAVTVFLARRLNPKKGELQSSGRLLLLHGVTPELMTANAILFHYAKESRPFPSFRLYANEMSQDVKARGASQVDRNRARNHQSTGPS